MDTVDKVQNPEVIDTHNVQDTATCRCMHLPTHARAQPLLFDERNITPASVENLVRRRPEIQRRITNDKVDGHVVDFHNFAARKAHHPHEINPERLIAQDGDAFSTEEALVER